MNGLRFKTGTVADSIGTPTSTTSQQPAPRHERGPLDVAIQGLIFLAIILLVYGVIAIARATWRKLRSHSPEQYAEQAGVIAGTAGRKVGDIGRAFIKGARGR